MTSPALSQTPTARRMSWRWRILGLIDGRALHHSKGKIRFRLLWTAMHFARVGGLMEATCKSGSSRLGKSQLKKTHPLASAQHLLTPTTIEASVWEWGLFLSSSTSLVLWDITQGSQVLRCKLKSSTLVNFTVLSWDLLIATGFGICPVTRQI